MLLASYPDIGKEKQLPVYVTSIGLDYPQESVSYANAGTAQFLFSSVGEGEIEIGGEVHLLPEGGGVYLRGTEAYRYRPRSEEWKISFLTLGFGVPDCGELLFLGREWCVFDAGRREEHRQALRNIYEAVTLGSVYGAEKASALAYALLVELNGETEGRVGKLGSPNASVASIIAYIDENYTHDITLEQLCTAAGGLSAQYLCRLFKQNTGLRPMEYMLRCRVSAARTYLERMDIPISEVAVRSGFNNTSYFYRNFRKFVGLSPLAYRQSVLGME